MSNWWKNPVLQGEDNDYGDYDYLINELPNDYNRWEWNKTKYIDDSGHYSHLRKVWCHYFYTLDGYDSMEGSECWRCVLKSMIRHLQYKIKTFFKNSKNLIEVYVYCRKHKISIKKSIQVIKQEYRWLGR